MGEVVLFIAASLDGFIARKDGDISWLQKYEGKKEDYGYSEFMKTVGASIMGSKTYEKCLTFPNWPEDEKPIFVVTNRKLKAANRANVSFYSGGLARLVKRLKQENKGNVWLVGGGSLVQSFLKEKLVDRIILSTIPVVLGMGISLFGQANGNTDFELASVKKYESGIIQADYKVKK